MKKGINALVAFIGLSVVSIGQAEIVFDEPYVRAMPPHTVNSAAFATITNTSDTDLSIVSVNTKVAKKTEIHTHFHEDGLMKMRQIPSLSLPATETVELKSGGLHLMLFDINDTLTEGELVKIEMDLSDGSRITHYFPVKNIHSVSEHHKRVSR